MRGLTLLLVGCGVITLMAQQPQPSSVATKIASGINTVGDIAMKFITERHGQKLQELQLLQNQKQMQQRKLRKDEINILGIVILI